MSPATPAAPLPIEFLRFAMVGASGTAAHYLMLWLGVERCGLSAAAAKSRLHRARLLAREYLVGVP